MLFTDLLSKGGKTEELIVSCKYTVVTNVCR